MNVLLLDCRDISFVIHKSEFLVLLLCVCIMVGLTQFYLV